MTKWQYLTNQATTKGKKEKKEATTMTATTTGIFEVHIAGPVALEEVTTATMRDLQQAGFPKNKFFGEVYNVPAANDCGHTCFTPPVGHDLENPGWMSTAKTMMYREARELAIKGMEVLEQHGLRGNFEIEQVIDAATHDVQIDVARDFPGVQRVKDSPAYENHIIWKAPQGRLPTYGSIVTEIQRKFGISPHQIANFARISLATKDTLVSRVATIYQPSREEALKYAAMLKPTDDLAGHKYIVTEQVCLVGEPVIKDNA